MNDLLGGKSKQKYFTGGKSIFFIGCKIRNDLYYRGKTPLTLFLIKKNKNIHVESTCALSESKLA